MLTEHCSGKIIIRPSFISIGASGITIESEYFLLKCILKDQSCIKLIMKVQYFQDVLFRVACNPYFFVIRSDQKEGNIFSKCELTDTKMVLRFNV